MIHNKKESVETALFIFLEDFLGEKVDGDVTVAIADYVMKNIYKADAVNNVRTFMQVGGTPVATEPTLPSKEALMLYLNLILEEVVEFAIASHHEGENYINAALLKAFNKVNAIATKMRKEGKENNIVDALDALVDLEYVMHNATNGLGLHNVFHDAHDLVHASNMSKFTRIKSEADATLEAYKAEGKDAVVVKVYDYYVVKRIEDGKILKAACWNEADLSGLV